MIGTDLHRNEFVRNPETLICTMFYTITEYLPDGSRKTSRILTEREKEQWKAWMLKAGKSIQVNEIQDPE